MAIQIKHIQIENLGPIQEKDFELGQVNLFYGENESGKTYLTEFILNSIFRHAATWQLREIHPSGAVSVAGLDQEIVRFSPSSHRKVEDYWADSKAGLPLNMARLLVVRGAELALSADSPGGVSRADLKNALTSQQLLEGIRNSIPATARHAAIVQGDVVGKNQGKVKDKNTIRDDLERIDGLLAEVEDAYSRGPLQKLEIQRAALQQELFLQQTAKAHTAYLLWNRHQQLVKERAELAEEDLLSIRDQIRDYRKIENDLANIKNRIEENSPGVDDYHWLSEAIHVWETLDLESKNPPASFFWISGGISLLVGSGLLIARELLQQSAYFWPGLAAVLTGIAALAYYGSQLYFWSKNPAESGERSSIKAAFKQRFDRELHGLTDLSHQQKELEKGYHQHDLLLDELTRFESSLNPAKEKIIGSFSRFSDHPLKEEAWENTLRDLRQKGKDLDQDIQEAFIAYAKLDLEPDQFNSEKPTTDYDPSRVSDLENSLEDLTAALKEHETQLANLKNKVCAWTKDDPSESWDTVLTNLRSLRQNTASSLITAIAELAAMVGLTEILDQLETEEDQKIIHTINQKRTSQLLKRLTGRYDQIALRGAELVILGGAREYPLRDLSTGARDQVQLALRLGMVNHLCGDQPLFLILDDAFQHADWKRRAKLVKEMIATAQEGWQLLYLTMDDHMKELFQKLVKPVFNEDYRYFELD